MTRGKSRTEFLGGIGLVTSQTAPSWEDIYRVSSVIDPKWNIGDLGVMPDGRKFRYCLSGDVCDTYKANIFRNSIGTGANDVGIDWSVLTESADIGDISVSMTAPASRAIAEDALRGGLIVLSITTGANATVQQRLITGNTAAAASAACVIYLDSPLVAALTTSSYCYCMPSPYSDVRYPDVLNGVGAYQGRMSFVGYAAAPVSSSGLYHWEQTAGMISASLYGSEVGKTQYHRDVVFRYDGNLMHRTAGAGDLYQRAGYIVDCNEADNGATVIMLQNEP